MMQSKKSETRKQIEWEIAIQDALKEVFEDASQNPCREIPLTRSGFSIKGTQTGRTSSLIASLVVNNKELLWL